MSDISDNEAREFASAYMADLRASMWKSVKADREKLLKDLGEQDSTLDGQTGNHGRDDYDLDALRLRSSVLRQQQDNQKSGQLQSGGSTYRVDETEVMNNSRVRTSSHSSTGSANDFKQINTNKEHSGRPSIGSTNKVHQNGRTNGVITQKPDTTNLSHLTVPNPDVSTADTPRTKELKDLRAKRLAYYEKMSPPLSTVQPARRQGNKTPRKKSPRKDEGTKKSVGDTIPDNLNFQSVLQSQRAKYKSVNPLDRGALGAASVIRESADSNFSGKSVKRDEQMRDITHLYGETESLSSDQTMDAVFDYCVEPVIDLKGLQDALKDGDDGLRKYLQEMGRIQQTDVTLKETKQGKPKIVNKFPKSPKDRTEVNFQRRLNHLESSSSLTSMSFGEKNILSPGSGRKADDSLPTEKQNLWEERAVQERPKEAAPKNDNKNKKNKLAESKAKSKVDSPKVSSKELESLGLYEDLFRESKEEKLNNEMTNLKTSLMKRDPPLTRNYNITSNQQQSLIVTDGSRAGPERQLPGIARRSTTKPTNLSLDISDMGSDSDTSDRLDGIQHVKNEWSLRRETNTEGGSTSDLELETHRPDIRPISPLKQIKSNIPTPKSNRFPDSEEERKKTNIFNNGIGVTPRLQTPKKPEGVPNLNLEPSSSSEESDHIEFFDFKEESKVKKSGPNKLSRPKERVMKSEFSLRLSIDSNTSVTNELVESELIPLKKNTNLSSKVNHSISTQNKEGRSPKSKKVPKSLFSPKPVYDEVVLSTHRPSPTESARLSKSIDAGRQPMLSSHDLMNEMYDDWMQAHATTVPHNVFLNQTQTDHIAPSGPDAAPMTHNVFLNQSTKKSTSESPRDDFFQDPTDQKVKRQPTGRSAVSVSDFLTGIELQHSEGKTENAIFEQKEPAKMKPFNRAEIILKANSKRVHSDSSADMRKHNAETYKVLEKNFSDVEKKLAELGLEHLLDENKTPDFGNATDCLAQMIKVCPQCDAINREHITWCLECGCVLIGVQSEPHPDIVRAISSNYRSKEDKPHKEDIPEVKPSPQNDKLSPQNINKDQKHSEPPRPETHSKHELHFDLHKSSIEQTVPKVFTARCLPVSEEISHTKSESKDSLAKEPVEERQLTAYEQYLLHLERQKQAEGTHLEKPTSDGMENVKEPREMFDDISDGSQGTSQDGESASSPEQENDVSVVEDSSDVPDDATHPLFEMMLKDRRTKPGVSLPASAQPRPSTAGPQRSATEDTQTRQPRPSSSGSKSRTRQYVEEGPYQRHWSRSSTAWDTYNKNELSTWSSLDATKNLSPHVRPLSAKASARATTTTGNTARNKTKPGRQTSNNNNNNNESRKQRPKSASTKHKNDTGSGNENPQRSKSALSQREAKSQDDPFFQVNSAQLSDSTTRALNSQGPSSVPPLTLKLLMESPREGRGLSIWQLLPDEILLKIFSYLNHKDLTRCALVCHQFDRITRDDTLWRQISIEKKTLHDEWLEEIGKKCPTSLSLMQCRGARISSAGLRSLFRACSASLEELNISGCSQGELVGDSVLLHATRCPGLAVIDASWCNVTDNAMIAIADSSNSLEAVCLNGCQAITDEALYAIVKKHSNSLQLLELFGCFNLTAEAILVLGSYCKNLCSLNIGQCYKVTDECMAQLSTHLKQVEHLDLRGCKQIKDNCVRKIVRNCRNLQSLVLANCPLVTDNALVEIATYLPSIRSLDVSGCKKITNTGVRSIAMSCPDLAHLDISSTGVNHKSVTTIASYMNKHLETLKLSFCSDITEASVIKLARNCKQLRVVHLYGVRGLRRLSSMRSEFKFFVFD